MKDERSLGAALMVLATFAILAGAFLLPWFDYDYSSGRTTPPDGPQAEEDTGVTRHAVDFWAYEYQGDVEPRDVDKADQAVLWIPIALGAGAGLLLLTVLGEIPGVSRIIGRPVGLGLLAGAFACIGAAAWMGWEWIPASMGDMVRGPYSAFLIEPDGYARSSMRIGWTMSLLALPFTAGAWLFKLQAGATGPASIREHLPTKH